ncbi:MAG: cell division protein FtsA [Bacteroidales bacterium]|nr:cell division protein FtsA [Bacteroidales bacterium]
MQERYIATVDLGSSKLALCVAKIIGENVQIIYYKERPSTHIRYSCVFNPKKAAGPLRAAIAEAEDELQIKILQVAVGLPRYNVHQETASARIDRSDPSSLIGDDEIAALKGIALDTYPLSDSDKELIYGAVPQSFSTDDFIGGEDDVVGSTSDSLSGNFKIFVGAKKAVKNIDIMLNDAGVALAQAIFTPSAVGQAVLKDDEMTNGVALVEMGGGVTSLSIYQGGIMRYYASIPFGGKSISTDIRLECAFDDTLAENIKLAFGACLPDKLQTMSDKVLQINDEENGTYEHLGVKYLSEIITSRCREIIQAILFLIQESGFADRLRCGIVLTGGGANLANLTNLIKEESGYNVRVGFPLARKFSSDGCPGIGEAEAAASVGMILEASNDPFLNCIAEASVKNEAETNPEPVRDPEPDANGQGNLFGSDDFDTVVKEKIVKTPSNGKKRTPKPKAPKNDKPSGFKIFWTNVEKKVGSVFEKGFEGTLAGLYDDMGNNNEEK